MAATTKIQWTDATFNPWRGCTKVSEGCRFCYAESGSKRNPLVLGVWGPNGTRVLAAEQKWLEVLGWERRAAKTGRPIKVFCASLADVFEAWPRQMTDPQGNPLWWHPTDERQEPRVYANRAGEFVPHPEFRPYTLDEARARLWRLIAATPHLIWQLVTKRPENMRPPFVPDSWARGWPRNVWAITSVENQATADERIAELMKVPATVRGLSLEPLLGPVDVWGAVRRAERRADVVEAMDRHPAEDMQHLHWAILGGESGPHARQCHLEWLRDLVRQLRGSLAIFLKQVGANATEPDVRAPEPGVVEFGCRRSLPLVDPKGGAPEEWPDDLRIREFPL